MKRGHGRGRSRIGRRGLSGRGRSRLGRQGKSQGKSQVAVGSHRGPTWQLLPMSYQYIMYAMSSSSSIAPITAQRHDAGNLCRQVGSSSSSSRHVA